MKKVIVAGVLAIVCLGLDIILAATSFGLDDFEEGYNAGYNAVENASKKVKEEDENALETILYNAPVEIFVSGLNPDNKDVSRIVRTIPFSVPMAIFNSFRIICLFVCVYSIYCIIRLLISVYRNQIFNNKNVFRIRIFAYASLSYSLLNTCYEHAANAQILKTVVLTDYKIRNYAFSETDYATIAVIILLAETFAVGVKIKEEQDLTI